MKITFNPHILGMGHRTKCNLIAKKLTSIDPKIKIKFLLRRDDQVPPEKWLDFDFVKDKWRRSYEIVTSNCLIEDGAWFNDFRVKMLSKMGGKIVAISLPYGFLPDFSTIKKLLYPVDMILVPWPKDLFRWPSELSEFEYKVKRIDPILNLPEGSKSGTGSKSIYVSISRETDKIFPIIREAVDSLKYNLPDLKLNISGSYKDFKDDTQHHKILMSSDLVIGQGMTTIFETCYLGIPRICIPLPWVEEQMVTSEMMMKKGAAFSLPLEELDVDRLSTTILDTIDNPLIKDEMIKKGKELVPKSGLNDAAQLILEILK